MRFVFPGIDVGGCVQYSRGRSPNLYEQMALFSASGCCRAVLLFPEVLCCRVSLFVAFVEPEVSWAQPAAGECCAVLLFVEVRWRRCSLSVAFVIL